MSNILFLLAMAPQPNQRGGSLLSSLILLSIIILILIPIFTRGKKRTIILKPPANKIYDRSFKWFSIQGYEMLEQIKDEKLKVNLRTISFPVYFIVGLLLLAMGLLPGIFWFFYHSGKITITFEESSDGTYLLALLNGIKATSTYNQLVGVLSMLEE